MWCILQKTGKKQEDVKSRIPVPLNMELQSLNITKNNKFAPAQKEVRTMKVKVIKRYNDLILKKIQEKNTVFDVTESRGKYLIEQGMV